MEKEKTIGKRKTYQKGKTPLEKKPITKKPIGKKNFLENQKSWKEKPIGRIKMRRKKYLLTRKKLIAREKINLFEDKKNLL